MKPLRERIDHDGRKVCVVMPAYNAEGTLQATLNEIPPGFVDEIIVVDDHSPDATSEVAKKLGLQVIRHPENRGYGGNQKTCYDTAIESGADIIVMLHPDNQYNPAIIPNLLVPLFLEQADAVLASRFIMDPLLGGPIAGGMPRHKFYLNKILTWAENLLMGTFFSEFHTGYRAFTRQTLERMDYHLMSDDFAFDNQMITALVELKVDIQQIGVETRYFPEASSISLLPGIRYASSCMWNGFRYFLHRKNIRRWDWLDAVCRKSSASEPRGEVESKA